MIIENELSRQIIGKAIDVHKVLGPGIAGISVQGVFISRTCKRRVVYRKGKRMSNRLQRR
jgi:hypothetical protein